MTRNGEPKTAYSDETVYIGALAAGMSVLENLTFEQCEIVGPAILFINPDWKITLTSPSFGIPGGRFDDLVWEVPPSKNAVIGAVGVKDCTFRGCRFEGVGLAGAPVVIAHIRKAL